jgi:hypothetical protein
MPTSNHFVGLDVSLKETSICVIDDADTVIWRGRTASTGDAMAPPSRRMLCADRLRERPTRGLAVPSAKNRAASPSSASMPGMPRLRYRSKSTKPTPTTRGEWLASCVSVGIGRFRSRNSIVMP